MMRGGGGQPLAPSAYKGDLLARLPVLTKVADVDTSILFQLDSSDMQPEHWIEIARAVHAQLPNYDGIVIVSGDGLVYEVINGLMKREDGAAAVGRMPIGILPAGTGNGLAKSLLCALLSPRSSPASVFLSLPLVLLLLRFEWPKLWPRRSGFGAQADSVLRGSLQLLRVSRTTSSPRRC